MSGRETSRERALGKVILSDPVLAEALAALADDEHRLLQNALWYVATLGLRDAGYVSYSSGTGWVAGPRLEGYRRRDDPEPTGILIPFLPWKRTTEKGNSAKGA